MDNEFTTTNMPIHPGRTLAFVLEARDIDLEDFAKKAEIDFVTLRSLIECEIALSQEIAQKLAVFFGTSVDAWQNMQNSYERDLQNL